MAVNKVMYGNQTVLDLTSVTAKESDVMQGYTFHKANGEQAVGAAGCEVQYPTIIIPGQTFKTVSWSSGSIEDIIKMIDLHYKNMIDLYDYWSVGNTRNVTLTTGETVQMVLLNKGGKSFVTPIGDKTTCAFIVGQKNCLTTTMSMHNDTADRPHWNDCLRRSWCNSTYRSRIPANLRPYFRQIKNTNNYGGTTNDYFALATQAEITGSSNWTYYKTVATNQNKGYGKDGDERYWTRTANGDAGNNNFYQMGYGYDYMTRAYGIAPFGAI